MEKIYVKKMLNGVVTPFVITLDADRLVISEKPEVENSTEAVEAVSPPSEVEDPRELEMRARGIVFHRSEDGGIVIDSIPAEEQQNYAFFSEGAPCFFTGCEELKANYEADKAKLGNDCPSCEKGALIRKYLTLIRKARE